MFRAPGGRPTSLQISPNSKQVLQLNFQICVFKDATNKDKGYIDSMIRTDIDASSDGLSIAAQPAARAGATFHVAINSG